MEKIEVNNSGSTIAIRPLKPKIAVPSQILLHYCDQSQSFITLVLI